MGEYAKIPLDIDSMSPLAEDLYNFMRERIKGQDEALRAVASAYELTISSMHRKNRPQAVALFLGPSGVGKTLVAKVLAEYLFQDPNGFTKIECAGFSEEHKVALLLGSPPGYIGFQKESTGSYPLLSQVNISKHARLARGKDPEVQELLRKYDRIKAQEDRLLEELKTLDKNSPEFHKKEDEWQQVHDASSAAEAVIETFFNDAPDLPSIVLFDEIEKAHPTMHNVLLEIMDEGRLTLSNGEVVDFHASFIFLTSNVGAKSISELLRGKQMGFKKKAEASDLALKSKVVDAANSEVPDAFITEFLGRIDNIIVFQPLLRETLREIFNAAFHKLRDDLIEGNIPIIIRLDYPVREFIIDRATEHPEWGAREIEKKIDVYLRKPLARLENQGPEVGIKKGDVVEVRLGKKNNIPVIEFFRSERNGDEDGFILPEFLIPPRHEDEDEEDGDEKDKS